MIIRTSLSYRCLNSASRAGRKTSPLSEALQFLMSSETASGFFSEARICLFFKQIIISIVSKALGCLLLPAGTSPTSKAQRRARVPANCKLTATSAPRASHQHPLGDTPREAAGALGEQQESKTLHLRSLKPQVSHPDLQLNSLYFTFHPPHLSPGIIFFS